MGVLTVASQALASRFRFGGTQREPPEAAAASLGLPGLANLGNTCFANSVLQCLLNTPGELSGVCDVFNQSEIGALVTQSKKALVGRAFQRLIQDYNGTECSVLDGANSALRDLKDAVAAVDSQFAGCQQQDAYEFLGCLLESLEDGLADLAKSIGPGRPVPNAQMIREICGVSIFTRRTCERCSSCFEVDRVTNTALGLPLLSPAAQFDPATLRSEESTPISLEDLLDVARQPETIPDYDCDTCREKSNTAGEAHARSIMTQCANVISSTGDILVVVLYRFGNALDARGNFNPIKIKRQVMCPTELSIDTGKYSLYGVVSHFGSSVSSGHYVAAVRSRRDNLWYECDDRSVQPMPLKALYDGRSVTSVHPGAEPFILFYRRAPIAAKSGKDKGGKHHGTAWHAPTAGFRRVTLDPEPMKVGSPSSQSDDREVSTASPCSQDAPCRSEPDEESPRVEQEWTFVSTQSQASAAVFVGASFESAATVEHEENCDPERRDVHVLVLKQRSQNGDFCSVTDIGRCSISV